MSACKGGTTDLDLKGKLPSNCLLCTHPCFHSHTPQSDTLGSLGCLGGCVGGCGGVILLTLEGSSQRQIPKRRYSSPAERAGQEEHFTALHLQQHLQIKSRGAFCCVPFGTFVIGVPATLPHAEKSPDQHCLPEATVFSPRPVLPALILVSQPREGSLCCLYGEECCTADLFGRFPILRFRITILRECSSVSPATSLTLDR